MNQKEKEYISALIAPFREKVIAISKNKGDCGHYIDIYYWDDLSGHDDNIILPHFKPGTMFKKMKVDTDYKLEELGL